MADIGAMVEANLVQAAKVMEEQLDAEIDKLEKMDEDGLEALRQKRVRKQHIHATLTLFLRSTWTLFSHK